MERARAARLHEEPEQRLPRPKLILSVAWRTKRDTLRAFHLALVPAKAMYGVAVWHWGASPASRSTPKSAQYQKSKMISGIPKGSRMEDAALETEPRPLPDVVLGRRFRCELLCETHGSALRPSAPIVRRPPLAIVPLRMAPTNPGTRLVAAGSPAASDAKTLCHTQKENTTKHGQTAAWSPESNPERRRCPA
ncbi:hypothetical protein TcBrA4_0051850 [Trypanosoma cruzi]|nr:hypothetical protein TcBrA4_0051850 [Trypanosoma cruzi]